MLPTEPLSLQAGPGIPSGFQVSACNFYTVFNKSHQSINKDPLVSHCSKPREEDSGGIITLNLQAQLLFLLKSFINIFWARFFHMAEESRGCQEAGHHSLILRATLLWLQLGDHLEKLRECLNVCQWGIGAA